MRLTKKLKAEILKVYNAYWDSYFKGDMRAFASLLHENVQIIGSSENEVFGDKRSAMKFYKATAGQVAGKAGIQNRKIAMRAVDNNVLVIEQSDFYVLIDNEWTFYGHGRISTLLQKTNKGWKIIHEHGSLPDSKAGEGEQVNTERIKAENQQLREAVKRRTIELEQKNHELEIETALERVRAVAMGMKQPSDMLEICRTISRQLQLLDVKEIRNVQTAIFYKPRGTYMNYEYYAKHDKTFITETTYTDNRLHKAFAVKMMKGKGEIFTTHIKGTKVKDWIAYQKTTNVFIDKYLNKAPSLSYYWYSLGPVALGISTYAPLNKEEIDLFKRFRNVFELAYRRYLDIEKAEAQAKEAKIEAALERVRAVAMSMMKSDDLLKVCEVVFDELRSLGFSSDELRNTQIVINNDEKGMYHGYQYSDYIRGEKAEVPYNLHPIIKMLNERLRASTSAFADIAITGKQMKDWKNFVNSFPQKHDKKLNDAKELHYYFYSVGIGALGISSFKSLDEEKLKMLQRLRNVFQLSYQRYVDIALAEEQAREAQVEAALERVRAAALGMRTPHDLLNICEVVFRGLTALGFSEMRNAMVNIHNDEMGTFVNYDYSDDVGKSINNLTYNIHPVIEKQIRKIRSASDAFSETIFKGKELEEWKQFRKDVGEPDDPRVEKTSSLHYYLFSIGNGSIGISAFSSLSDEKRNLLQRFRNVFDLAYKRFSDIALAEAQAREAKIELALERVRARTMAMQRSDELAETASVLFQQFKELDRVPQMITIGIMNEQDGVIEFWVTDWSGSGSTVNRKFNASIEEPVLLSKIHSAWKEQRKSIVVELAGKELQDWINYRVALSGVPDDKDYSNTKASVVAANFSKGIISISSHEPQSQETVQLLERFAGVFDGTYTRFLDLQKAEAQAREAQIETALEKVRSRSMGMQKSEELKEVIQVVYEQFVHLNIQVEHTGFIMDYKERDDMHIWLADKHAVPFQVTIPYFDCAHWNSFNEAKEKGLDFFANHLSFEEKNKFYQDLFKLIPGVPEETLEYYFSCAGLAISTVLLENVGLYIENFSGIPYTDEENNTLMRFGNVFQQTYTRFLDLQRAEAQAREAKIEAALEKVRSRSLAMHKSDELNEVVTILFEKLKELQIPVTAVGIGIYIDGSKDMNSFVCGENKDGLVISNYRLPYFHHKIWEDFNNARKKQLDFFTANYSKEEKNSFYEYLFEHAASLRHLPDDIKSLIFESPTYTISMVAVNNALFNINDFEGKNLSENEVDIIKRFARVFDQAYTRFLDLQKAEAQAREAKIEAALERTRTQSMIMQHSKELDDTLRVFHEQVLLLGIPSAFSFLWLPDEGKDRHIFWAAWAENNSKAFKSKAINYPLDRNEPATAQCLIDWKSNEPVVSYHVPPDGVKSYFAAWSELIAGVEQLKPEYFSGGLYYVEAFMKYGCFGVMVATDLTEDEKKILGRFAVEFERTYTRFLDLQKAEAQAKEAQVEAAMERVRAKAMAMHNSADLSITVSAVFAELRKLGVNPIRTGVALYSKDRGTATFYAATTSMDSDALAITGSPDPSINPCLAMQYEAWRKKENYSPVLRDEELKAYYNALSLQPSAQNKYGKPFDHEEYGYYMPFSEGNFYAWSEKPCTDDEISLLTRFKTIIDLTFRRYLDLQKAEAQARESQIEASLERVRSRTLAMQKSDELAETAAVLFRQLIILGIAPNRLYIAIMKDESGNAEFWITDEDGSKVSTGFAADLHGNGSFQKMFDGWQEGKKSITIDMQGKELEEYFHHLSSLNVPFKGGLSQTRRVQNIAYFSRGFLGIASPDKQPEETTTLLERFAAVFNLTLTRFTDLKLAEAQAHQAHLDLMQLQTEKKRAEDALSELSATQAQLVQQEKLASLGQLTAGIAHEIKNPLNFVNNFSSVSVELVDEVMEEITKSASHLSTGEVPHLLADIKANLTKIIEHGARADGIVKSMLQHSRGGASRMEPTDLNALIKEFANLAFHGMRASKNPINVDIELDFDKAIGNVLLKAEDFSRVIINLCQNAFDAMREKANTRDQELGSYLPKLTVRTRREENRISVQVEDNGPGIPDAIRDKVLQPFFTTKKGTQGTGLGLSISNDIVKAHGGEMKIESNGNGGATFVIMLPTETEK